MSQKEVAKKNLQKVDDDKQDHWRNIDASKIGEHPTNWSQQWLCERVQRIPDCTHKIIVDIDNVEGDEPRHYRRDDNDVSIDLQNQKDDREKSGEERVHEGSGIPASGIRLPVERRLCKSASQAQNLCRSAALH
jgi:hypothetical protein